MMARRIHAAVLGAICIAISPNAWPQENPIPRPDQTSENRSLPTVAEELQRLDKGVYSGLIALVLDPQASAELELSGKQRGLVQNIDQLTRAILRSWLVRDPTRTEPNAGDRRLARPEAVIESRIIAHAEAIIRLGVLTNGQGVMIRPRADLKETPPLNGLSVQEFRIRRRPPKPRPRLALTREEFAELKSSIETEARLLLTNNDHASYFFANLTWKNTSSKIGISQEQSRHIARLDQLTRDIVRNWLLRGLDAAVPPVDLFDRLSEIGVHHRARIIAHAEAIASLGILTPEQLEASKRQMWRELGSRALLDPELADRIRLSRAQREEIVTRLTGRQLTQEHADATIGPLRSRTFEDGGRIAREADLEIRRQIDEADARVWDVLDESQIERLRIIVNSDPKPSRQRQ